MLSLSKHLYRLVTNGVVEMLRQAQHDELCYVNNY
jgi:hypothetical protein